MPPTLDELHTELATSDQLEALDRLLMARVDKRDITQAFLACARDCREAGIPEAMVADALAVDSARRGELPGWAVLDSVLISEAWR